MSEIEFWVIFISTVTAVLVIPGPDVVYILSETLSKGRKYGIAATFGVCTGAICYVALSSFSILMLFNVSQSAMDVVKSLGSIYLIYIAFNYLMSDGSRVSVFSHVDSGRVLWKSYRRGILINLLNPKVGVFFLSYLSQFIRDGFGSPSVQMAYLGAITVSIAMFVELVYVLAAAKLSTTLRATGKAISVLNKAAGILLIALAIRMLFS